MNPFDHPQKGPVDANFIRASLGSFQGTELLRQPSKFAARLAQAFTATDPSVDIHREEWNEMPDLGKKPYQFTDGVGTISKALGDRIWAKLCERKRNPGHIIQPSAVSCSSIRIFLSIPFDHEYNLMLPQVSNSIPRL
jgi:RNA-dependent RNA polymerase